MLSLAENSENWYGYDDEKHDVFVPDTDQDTYVNGHLNADDIAKIFSIISQKKVDIRTSE